MWIDGRPDPGAEQEQHRDERDVRETRHGDGEARRRGGPRAGARPSTSSPTRPPSQTEPARGGASRARARGRAAPSARRGPPRPARGAPRPPPTSAPHGGEQLGDRAVLAVGPVDPERDRRPRRRTARSRARGRGSRARTPTCRNSGTSVADRRTPSAARTRAVAQQEVDGIARSPTAAATANAERDAPQARVALPPHERPRDREPEHEQADRRHDGEEHDPAGRDEARRRRRLRDRRHRELRRRAGVRARPRR